MNSNNMFVCYLYSDWSNQFCYISRQELLSSSWKLLDQRMNSFRKPPLAACAISGDWPWKRTSPKSKHRQTEVLTEEGLSMGGGGNTQLLCILKSLRTSLKRYEWIIKKIHGINYVGNVLYLKNNAFVIKNFRSKINKNTNQYKNNRVFNFS